MGGRRFEGRSAIVTGAGSGIGRALATRLAAEGATVVVTDVDGDAATVVAGELGDGHVARPLDVRDLAATRALVGEVADRHGGVDLFVANAGIALGGPAEELTPEHWDRVIDVNVRGAVHAVQAAYPRMVARGSGQIVLTASGAGLAPPPLVAPYAMSKHAVVGLGLGLRAEASLHGVRVNVLCPGAVETPILDRRPPADLPATATPRLTAREYLHVMKQTPMPVDEFALRALRQIARDRPVITVQASTRTLWVLHAVAPGAFDRVTRVLARRVLDSIATAPD
ncbi:MAG TPA: SDR family oxidoreductase [Acidimicrobiales bacterium]|nr:SDR family oxidoreductase [Acidimicrobiales bacterium]